MRRDFEIAWIAVMIFAFILVALGIWNAMLQSYQNVPEGTNLTGPGVQFFIHFGVVVFVVMVILLFFAGLLDGNGGAWEPPPGGAGI